MPFYPTHLAGSLNNCYVEAVDHATATALAAELFGGRRHTVLERALPVFATVDEACVKFALEMADEECKDNYRAAFADDIEAMAAYDAQANEGCCGSTDKAYLVAGRIYYIGCNYGH